MWLGTKPIRLLSLFSFSVTVNLVLFKLTMESTEVLKQSSPQADYPAMATASANTVKVIQDSEEHTVWVTAYPTSDCESA